MRIMIIVSVVLIICSENTVAQENLGDLNMRVTQLEKTVNELKDTIHEMENAGLPISRAVNPELIKGTLPNLAGGNESIAELSGTYSLDHDFVQCPPGSFVAAIQGFTRGGPIYGLRYLCRKL
jgi:hypothetical protein